MKVDCWYRDRHAEKVTTLVAEEKEVSNLFMAECEEEEERTTSVWLVDSGCSNHMSGAREMFKDLDETQKITIRLGDDKEILVQGRGMVSLAAYEGRTKLLHDVQYVSGLAHNLLSVGQLLASG